MEDLKDESEPYRRMVMETVDKVVGALGAADIDARLEEQLVDGILYAFQEQARSFFWGGALLYAFCGCTKPWGLGFRGGRHHEQVRLSWERRGTGGVCG